MLLSKTLYYRKLLWSFNKDSTTPPLHFSSPHLLPVLHWYWLFKRLGNYQKICFLMMYHSVTALLVLIHWHVLQHVHRPYCQQTRWCWLLGKQHRSHLDPARYQLLHGKQGTRRRLLGAQGLFQHEIGNLEAYAFEKLLWVLYVNVAVIPDDSLHVDIYGKKRSLQGVWTIWSLKVPSKLFCDSESAL